MEKTRELHTSQALDAINYEVLDDYLPNMNL